MEYYRIKDYPRENFARFYKRKDYLKIRKKIKKILVLIGKPGLGDLIISIPFFTTLRKFFPEAKISYLGKIAPFLKNLFSLLPVDEKLYFDPERKLNYASLPKRFHSANFNLLIDTQRYAIPSLLFALIPAQYRVSYSSKGLFSHWKFAEPDRKKVHDLCQSLALLRALGIEECNFSPRIPLPEKYMGLAREYLESRGRIYPTRNNGFDESSRYNRGYFALIPGAGQTFKCWMPEKFAAIGDKLAKKGYQIILIGNKKDKKILESVKERMEEKALIPLTEKEIFGTEPLYSAGLLKLCKGVIGNDCGGIHLATLVGTPVVAIYGPTNPVKFGPLGKNNVVLYKNYPCSPCKKKYCPFNRKCLTDISEKEVEDAVAKML